MSIQRQCLEIGHL